MSLLTNKAQTMLSFSRTIKLNAPMYLNLIGEPKVLCLRNLPKCYPFIFSSNRGMAWIKVKYVILEKTQKKGGRGGIMPWINVIVILSSYEGQDGQ